MEIQYTTDHSVLKKRLDVYSSLDTHYNIHLVGQVWCWVRLLFRTLQSILVHLRLIETRFLVSFVIIVPKLDQSSKMRGSSNRTLKKFLSLVRTFQIMSDPYVISPTVVMWLRSRRYPNLEWRLIRIKPSALIKKIPTPAWTSGCGRARRDNWWISGSDDKGW